MIELILTNTLDSAPILEKLKNSQGKAKKHVLFVPDRFSLSYQKAVLEYLDIKGTFDIEVTSFPRLANQLLKGKRRLMDKQSEIMLLEKVIEDNKSNLRCFSNVSKSGDFANDMYAAISQIRNSNIRVEKMAEAIDGLPKRVADKTRDIVTVYGDYVRFLQDGYADGTSKLQALAELISGGILRDYNVYISDFMSFSNVEYEIIQALMLNCENTFISLVDGDGENSQVFPYEVKKRLLSLAEQSGAGVKISRVEQKLSGDALLVHKGLYGYAKVSGERDNRISIAACRDISNEVRSVAREINELIKNGARYKDIAIVCCDFAAYAPYIKNAFECFSIPYYADVKSPLREQTVSRLIMSAMRVVIEDFARPEVMDFVKHPFVSQDCEEACIFENYCLRYGIEYTRFLSPFTIGEESARNVAEIARQRLVACLSAIDRREGSVRDFVAMIRKFLDALQVEKLVEDLAEKQNAAGYGELSSITLQSLAKIENLLSQCEAMLGDHNMSLEEFCSVMSAAIDSVEMSNIPLHVDCVFIGESSESRYENIDYMYIIGATAGKFPLEHNDSGIVSEREYVAWGKMGIDVQPDCRRRNSQERLNVLMMLTRARKGLRVSYAVSGVGGEKTEPSSTVHYLCELLSTAPKPDKILDSGWNIDDYAKYVSAKGNAVAELLNLNSLIKNGGLEMSETALEVEDALYALACEEKGAGYIDRLLGGDGDEDSLDGVGGIMFNGSHTSVSQFEKYFKCPFLHFNENVLKLKRREISGLEVKDTGILLHATLEKYFSLADCADKSAENIEKTVPELFMQALEEEPDYAFMLDSDQHALTLKQLIAQAVYVVKNLVANMQVTKFRPTMLEASFGERYPDRCDLKGMEIDSGYRKLSFEGVIDRIDTYKDRAIVVDYKSKYNIRFAPSNILCGDRIQLFVYLNALKNNRNVIPQGVFYLLINNRFVQSGDRLGKRFMHCGFVNCEEELLPDLDSGFARGDAFAGDVYPIKRKIDKEGEVTYVKQERGEILDTEGFEDACDYVMKLTQKAAREIEEGYIAKSPLNIGGEEAVKACKYCDYAGVCSRSGVKVRNVKDVKIEEFREMIGGENVGDKLD